MQDIVSYSIRVLLVYVFTYFATRILSTKAMAEMSAYEAAGIMILANVAAEPLVDKVVVKSVYGTGALILLMLLTARLALINKLTPVLEHTPHILIKNGQVDMNILRKSLISLNQLEGLLRQQGYGNISDVQYAIMEPQGELTVIPKAAVRPIHLKDMNIKTQEEGLTLPIIIDGKIVKENLKHAGLNEEWLSSVLKQQGIKDYEKEVALAEINNSKKLIVSRM